MTAYRDLALDLYANLLRRDHQTLHTLGGMNKKFRQGTPICLQSNICRMLENFIGLHQEPLQSIISKSLLTQEKDGPEPSFSCVNMPISHCDYAPRTPTSRFLLQFLPEYHYPSRPPPIAGYCRGYKTPAPVRPLAIRDMAH